MRKRNAIINILSSIALQFTIISVNLITQRVFVDILGTEMLGLRGMFNNVISVLNLADIGLGAAIVFSMYKPLAQDNHEKTGALLHFYARIYQGIAAVITLLGFLFMPFIGFFVDSGIDIGYARTIFLFFIARTVVSYLFSYKVNLFIADQKRYIFTNISLIFVLLINISQIIILLKTKDYVLSLFVNVILLILQNLLISYLADRNYPYIRGKAKYKLDKISKKEILINTKALVFQRIGGVCINATDNLVLARLTDLTMVGLLSNYTLITTTIRNLAAQFFIGITASVGNLIAEEDWKGVEVWFWRIMFADFWIFGFSSICLFTLLSPFIGIWMGTTRVLEPQLIFLLVLNFYLLGMNRCTQIIRDSAGLYHPLRLMPLVEGLINLISSILLAYWFGAVGVLWGTLIGFVTCSLWVQPWVVFRYAFHKTQKRYYLKFALYLLVVFLVGIFTWWLCSMLVFSNRLIEFAAKTAVCAMAPNVLFMLLFWKEESFVYFRNLTLDMLKKFFRRPNAGETPKS